MKPFLILAALLVSACCAHAGLYGAVSTQYQQLDPHTHSYSYGYADSNSQKHETRSHDGVTRGSYSYVDGYGHVQSVSYTADPHHGFNAVGTNLPKGPQPEALAHAGGNYAAAHAYQAPYHGPLAHIQLTPAGVPVDTPEVQHAKAAHYAALAEASARAHDSHHLYKRSIYAGPWSYGPAHVALTPAGVPVETPEVQHAKAAHFAAHAKALGSLVHARGAPIDTPEVQHAKSAHFAAHAAARSGHISSSPLAYHVPIIHNGVPVDTPEVQHAKAAHYAALAEASARAGHSDEHDDGRYDARWEQSYEYDDGRYGSGSGSGIGSYASESGHKGPIHIPVIHNGVPVEPLEVQKARAAHLSAVAAASHGSHGGYYAGHYRR